MKNRSLLLLSILFGLHMASYGQDVIVLTNRAKLDAKEIVIKDKTVLYQNFDDDSGKVLSMLLSKIEYIQYTNGERLFPDDLIGRTKNSENLGFNLINFHVLDFATSNFTMSYERVLSDGKFSLQLPISFGYGDPNSDLLLPPPFDSEFELNFANRFTTGLCFNIFPTRQGRVRYFFGPSILGGSGIYSNGGYYDSYYGYYIEEEINTGYIAFMVNNGLIISPLAHFSISLVGSLGARHFFDVEGGKTATSGRLSFNLSYRF